MSCDCCGKVGANATKLLDIYKTNDIQDICDECAAVIDKQLRKLQTITGRIQNVLLKRFMQERKDKYSCSK